LFAFVLLVCVRMSFNTIDEFDLTPRAPPRPANTNTVLFGTPGSALPVATSEGFGGGFSDIEAAGEYGKPNLSEVAEDMDVTDDDDGRDTLFYLSVPFGDTLCGGVISSGQGIRRCCTLAVLEGTKTCGVLSHSVKAEVPPRSFCVRTKVKGGKGALTSKCILEADILAEDVKYFQTERHNPAEWERRFDLAKIAKYGDGPPVSQVAEVDDKECTILDFMPTPKKPRTQEQLAGGAGASSPGWVELPDGSELGLLKEIRTSSDDTPTRKSENVLAIGENFEILRKGLPKMMENSAASLGELREHYEKLANAVGKIDRRVGHSDGFGMMASVTSTFDGLRHLHEIGEERHAKFVKYPYESLVQELVDMDKAIANLQTVDRWSEEATALRQLNSQVVDSVNNLKSKTISNLVSFYRQFTTPGSAVPGDILANDVNRMQTSIMQLEAGGMSRPHTQVGFDHYGNQQGSGAQLTSILARLTKAESENARLAQELQELRSRSAGEQPARSGQSAAEVPAGAGQDIENRLIALESSGDLESITLGSQTFKSIQDCETFLYMHVPNDVLDTYAYDMVSLIHRVGRDSNAAGAVQREHTALKAGYKTSGSATLFASFQQALPGPFGVGASTANSSTHPIPALKDHATWDRQDGMTGLKTEVTHGIMTAVTAIRAAMNRDCQTNPVALLVFDTMITTGQLQWHQFANFLSERYMTSQHQIEDPKESWLFTSEIAKGVLTELHKIRVVAADRTSASHNHKDAARSLWVALQTQRLMGEFIALKFTGHPKLSPYSINHLFRHRVSLKAVDTMTNKFTKVENDLRSVTALQNKFKAKYPV
jgi:hypothetical protein